MKKKIVRCVLVFWIGVFSTNAQNSDIDLLQKININRNTALDPTFKSITNSAIPLSIAAPVVLYSIGLIQKDSVIKHKALFIGETFLVSAFVTLASKKIIKRERPYLRYTQIDPVVFEDSYSMPSGHTSSAFATATSLSLAFPKWYVIAPSFIWASSVGYSRMHLGVHYPSDVVAGALVGSASAFLTYKANQWINKRRNKKEIK